MDKTLGDCLDRFQILEVAQNKVMDRFTSLESVTDKHDQALKDLARQLSSLQQQLTGAEKEFYKASLGSPTITRTTGFKRVPKPNVLMIKIKTDREYPDFDKIQSGLNGICEKKSTASC